MPRGYATMDSICNKDEGLDEDEDRRRGGGLDGRVCVCVCPSLVLLARVGIRACIIT